MPSNEVEVENCAQTKEKFLFKEPLVLLSIICLRMVNGITAGIGRSTMFLDGGNIKPNIEFYSLCQIFVPMPGIMLMAFLSELKGRKPIFFALVLVSILTSIVQAISQQETCIYIGLVMQGIVNGGALTMTFLAIAEYCTPKHRFAYLIANEAIWEISIKMVVMYITEERLGTIYVKVFSMVLGLGCLVSVRAWPESPYWLASKGRVEESRAALLWLRGEGGAGELRTLTAECRRPGTTKLFWLPLFIAIVIISAGQLMNWQSIFILFYASDLHTSIVTKLTMIIDIICVTLVSCILALISYKVKRMTVYIVTCIGPLALNYVTALCFYMDKLDVPSSVINVITYIFYIFISCWPRVVSMALFIEIIPQKYNTEMSCICSLMNYFVDWGFYMLHVISKYIFHIPSYYTIPFFTTLSLVGVIVVYFLSPEAKDKTLLEIQRLYTPGCNVENSEQGQTAQILSHNVYS